MDIASKKSQKNAIIIKHDTEQPFFLIKKRVEKQKLR